MAEYDVKELDITKGGNTYKIKGETYESKSAASGGTDLSLVTTGEKYTWNNKASSDTKNTAGTSNKTGTKMFIAAATEQSANPQTYSNSDVYIGTDNCLYSGGTKVLTAHQDISGKKNTQSAVSDPSASGNSVTFISGISQNAQGVISPTKKTVATMGGASSSAAGSIGLVPKPNAGQHQLFLKGDGTWAEPDGVRLYVADLDTVTNTSGSYTHTSTVTGMTGDLKAVLIECSNPEIFRDKVTVTTGSGTVTLACSDVAGTSTVKVSFAVQGNANPLNSTEYAALDARIGDLSDLTTTDKSSVVGAVNALNSKTLKFIDNNTVINNPSQTIAADYTAPYDGFYCFACKGNGTVTACLYVNGAILLENQTNGWVSVLAPLKAGTIVTRKDSSGCSYALDSIFIIE